MKFVLAIVALAFAPSALAKPLRCDFTVKRQCDDTGQCRVLPPVVWGLFDPERKTYSRCDRNGCDTYDATVTHSGIYTVVSLPANGLFAKIADDGSAVEVASIGTDVLISYGKCKR